MIVIILTTFYLTHPQPSSEVWQALQGGGSINYYRHCEEQRDEAILNIPLPPSKGEF